jgi:hypothetical protein
MTALGRLPRMIRMLHLTGIARRLLLAAALTCLAGPALPQSSGGYVVEILVFRNGENVAALGESAARARVTGDDVAAAMVSSRKLGGSVARLNNRNLRVLGHAAWKQAPSGWKSRRGVSTSQLGLAGMTGKVILERGEFIHLGLDMIVEDGGKRYRLNEVRQVKLDEIQYFDHPAIGVIAIVSRDG